MTEEMLDGRIRERSGCGGGTEQWYRMRRVAMSTWRVTPYLASAGVVIVLALGFGVSACAATYDWHAVETGCGDKTAEIGTLTGGDHSQDQASQDAVWATWKANYGFVDADRQGNRTWLYNCSSYVFRNSDGWLNTWDAYIGTEAGCWEKDGAPPGECPVLHSNTHTCYDTDKLGKVGDGFLCKNNQKFYNGEGGRGTMPTDKYCQH